MSEVEITAKAGKEDDAPSATVTYDFGDSLAEAVDRFGESVVFNRFKSAVTIDIQALIRRELTGEKPASQDEIQEKVDEWKPGVQRSRKSKKDKALELLGAMSEDEKAEIMAELS